MNHSQINEGLRIQHSIEYLSSMCKALIAIFRITKLKKKKEKMNYLNLFPKNCRYTNMLWGFTPPPHHEMCIPHKNPWFSFYGEKYNLEDGQIHRKDEGSYQETDFYFIYLNWMASCCKAENRNCSFIIVLRIQCMFIISKL